MSKKRKSDAQRLGEILILLGTLVSLFFGILFILDLGVGITFLPTLNLSGILGALTTIFRGGSLILVSIITLASSGKIDFDPLELGRSWIIYLILGLVMYVLGGTLGGLLVIIGAILLLF